MSQILSTIGAHLETSTKQLSALVSADFIDHLNLHINEQLSSELNKVMGQIRDRFDAIDSIEYELGSTLAEQFAVQQGITDATILKTIREFGYHTASLWLQLELDDERDMQDAESYNETDYSLDNDVSEYYDDSDY